ncbi:MAG: peptidoglycan-binding protein [Acidimicrobiia bacterium]|nr:peptidoglycan-binding protein [Acidimicrobiia bacterium]
MTRREALRDPPNRHGLRRAGKPLVAVALAILVPAVAFALGRRVRSPEQAAAEARPPAPSLVTAPVEHRVLSQKLVFRGDVVAGTSIEIVPPALEDGAAPVVSGVRKGAGDVVEEGEVVVVVSDRPVIALQGTVPMYRSLRPGSRGSDVEELQVALERLGYPVGGDTPGLLGRGTQQALTAMYHDAGFEPAPTSEDDALKLAQARDAVASAQRNLESALRALDEAGGGRDHDRVGRDGARPGPPRRRGGRTDGPAGQRGGRRGGHVCPGGPGRASSGPRGDR